MIIILIGVVLRRTGSLPRRQVWSHALTKQKGEITHLGHCSGLCNIHENLTASRSSLLSGFVRWQQRVARLSHYAA
ncbi:hypothetical protein EV426DRAFT_607012 [Tirmania nivea]|nr:hypothetical protein EV426DRAFT_607012 [Tirmania nivea]